MEACHLILSPFFGFLSLYTSTSRMSPKTTIEFFYITAFLILVSADPFPVINTRVFSVGSEPRQLFLNGNAETVNEGDWIFFSCFANYPHRVVASPFNSEVRTTSTSVSISWTIQPHIINPKFCFVCSITHHPR